MAKRSALMRGIDDRKLSAALGNHQEVLRQLIQWVRRHDRVRKLTLAWQLAVTVAIIYILAVAL